jgi:hypothetical protein
MVVIVLWLTSNIRSCFYFFAGYSNIFLFQSSTQVHIAPKSAKTEQKAIGGIVLEVVYIQQQSPAVFDTTSWIQNKNGLTLFTITYNLASMNHFSIVEKETFLQQDLWFMKTAG